MNLADKNLANKCGSEELANKIILIFDNIMTLNCFK